MEKLIENTLNELSALPPNEQAIAFSEIRKGLLKMRACSVEELHCKMKSIEETIQLFNAGNEEIGYVGSEKLTRSAY